jgi:hypothetical protein
VSSIKKFGGSGQLTTSVIQEPMRGRAMDFQFDEKKLKFVQRVLNNRVLFKIALLFQVPINFMIGMRLRELNEESCKVSVPYRWLNKNGCGVRSTLFTDGIHKKVVLSFGY